jgi:hypothetical protein
VKAYVPKVNGRIDDLSTPAAEILRQLPGVAKVEVLVAAKKPTHRVIHLADWLEQEELLRCLLNHHLRRVLYEGLTPDETGPYRDKAAELREAGPQIRRPAGS